MKLKLMATAVALALLGGCSVVTMHGESETGIEASLKAFNQEGKASVTVMKDYIKVTSDAQEDL
ncbi:MAG: hypothetical protein AAFN81_32880 [Bacteroidota bacterium]